MTLSHLQKGWGVYEGKLGPLRTIFWSGGVCLDRSVSSTPDHCAGGAPFLKKRGSRALCTQPISSGVEREVARILLRCAFRLIAFKRQDSHRGAASTNRTLPAARNKRAVTRREPVVSSHVGCRARACWEQRLQDLCWKSAAWYSHKGRRGRILQIWYDSGYRLEEQERRAPVRLHRIRRPSVRSCSRWGLTLRLNSRCPSTAVAGLD